MPRRPNRRLAAARRVLAALPGLLATLLIAGCSSIVDQEQSFGWPIQDWHNVRPIPEPQVGLVQQRHTVTFAAGQPVLSAGQRQGLERFLEQFPPESQQTAFVIAGPGSPALRERRIAAVGSLLTANRRPWQPGAFAGEAELPPADDEIAVIVDVTVVVLPPCPNWSDWPQYSFSNRPNANFGCATAINLGMQVADPNDLRSGRSPGLSDGTVMSRSIERYREGKTKDIIRDSASSEAFPTSGGGSE